MYSAIIAIGPLIRTDVVGFLQRFLADSCTVLCATKKFAPHANAIRQCGHTLHTLPFPSEAARAAHDEVREADSYRNRFVAWLYRFRGVATRYLDHYLTWHRALALPDESDEAYAA